MDSIELMRPAFRIGFQPRRRRVVFVVEEEEKDQSTLEQTLPLPVVTVTRAELEKMPTFRKHW
jgi:hypothetical protein